MYRLFRIAAIAVGAVLLLLLTVAGIVALTADPNDYKGAITARVQDKFGRTLTISGAISLRFWPRPGVSIGRAQLSEHGGTAPFATVEGIGLSFALLPLLRGQFVVDRIELRGAQATLVRFADGRSNIDDLSAPRTPGTPGAGGTAGKPAPARPLAFAVGSIRVDNARVVLDDRRAGRRIDITRLNLDSGPIEHGVPSRVALSANVGLDRPAVSTAVIMASGFMLDRDMGRVALTGVDLNLDVTLKDAATHARAKLEGSVDLDLPKDVVNVVLKGRLDDSQIDIKGASHAGALRLALDIDKIDLGRYRSAKPGAAGAAAMPARLPNPAVPAPVSPAGPVPAPSLPDDPVDLSALATLRANGNLHIGALTVGGIALTNVDAVLRADAGKVALSPVLATLYGGRGKGALVLDYADAPATPRITLAQSLHGVELGPLLRDALGKAPVNGRGEVVIKLHTQGASRVALRQALQGTASARLADGSISGFNLPRLVRDIKVASGKSSDADKTDFSELTASFVITDGVARSDDLLVKTALLRVAGSGEIDLVGEQIDYTLMCTAVPTLQGQGGPGVEVLKGITVPLKLSGPLSDIAWQIDLKAMAEEPAVQKLKNKVTDRIKDKLRGILRP